MIKFQVSITIAYAWKNWKKFLILGTDCGDPMVIYFVYVCAKICIS